MNPIARLAARTATAFLAAAAASQLTACANEATPPDESVPDGANGIIAGTLMASASRPTLTLRNTTEQVVGYMVVEKNQMVVALYPPCGTDCPKLVQGAQITLPYASIAGYTNAATDAIVMWWRYARAADGTLTPSGAVQTIAVRL